MKLEIYTDGAVSNAGKPNVVAGWAFCLPNFCGKQFVRYGCLPNSTGNQGEIMGILYFLHLFHKRTDWKYEIKSDSEYVVKSVNEWRRKWELTNYADVKNKEYLLPLFSLFDQHSNTTLSWVRGHTGVIGNEIADQYAVKGKKQIVENIKTDKLDIQYVSWNDLPYYIHRDNK